MNTLVVLARVPVPGAGKSRLRHDLGDEVVDRLATALLADVLDWAVDAADALLVVHDGPAALLPSMPARVTLVPQAHGDLGARIDAAVAAGFSRGAARTVIIGTDCPTVPPELIDAAFAGLDQAASTLVPATDGGWIALGVDRPLGGILDAVSWSTARAGTETAAALVADGRPPLVLPPWHDIDEPADLAGLRWDSARRTRAPRTAALLATAAASTG